MEDDALAVFDAVADDRQVFLEVELKNAQRLRHVELGGRHCRERQNNVGLLDQRLDKRALFCHISLVEGKALVAKVWDDPVVAYIDPNDAPCRIVENTLEEVMADEAVNADYKDFFW